MATPQLTYRAEIFDNTKKSGTENPYINFESSEPDLDTFIALLRETYHKGRYDIISIYAQ